jgi:hypothetical protein
MRAFTGAVEATIAHKGVKSTQVTIASFLDATPSITVKNNDMAQSANGNRIQIHGTNFGTTQKHISVALVPAVKNEVVHCSDTVMWIDIEDTSSLATGALNALVTKATPGEMALTSVSTQVATVVAAILVPTLDVSTVQFASSETSLTLTVATSGLQIATFRYTYSL